MREFSHWVGGQVEKVCLRNDIPRPGKKLKPPWETVLADELYMKIHEEMLEVIDAYEEWFEYPTDRNRKALASELADVAATAMMMSARLDPVMSGLRRGRVRGREFPREKI